MTICNMSIEGGARAGLVAPDDTTYQYINGREFAQLSLRTVEPGPTVGGDQPAAASYVEFALRSSVAAAEVR